MASVTRQRNARGEGSRLREPLLHAAIDLIDETGDAGKLSVRAITRRVGVSPTALYLHFDSVEAIIDAAVDAGFAAFNSAVLEAAAEAEDPRAQLLAMGHAYLSFAERQPALYAVIFASRRPMRRFVERRAEDVDRGAAFEGLIALAGAAGADDAVSVAYAMWAGLHGYATLHIHDPVKEWPAHEPFLARMVDAYLTPPR